MRDNRNYTNYELEIIDTLHWIITETIKLGFDNDSRDAKKVNFLHENIKTLLLRYIDLDKYDILLE